MPQSWCGFSTLLDIDKLTPQGTSADDEVCFSTLLDIDKLTPYRVKNRGRRSFSTLLDIDKLTLQPVCMLLCLVLVLCWILINLHFLIASR